MLQIIQSDALLIDTGKVICSLRNERDCLNLSGFALYTIENPNCKAKHFILLIKLLYY